MLGDKSVRYLAGFSGEDASVLVLPMRRAPDGLAFQAAGSGGEHPSEDS